MVRMLLLVIALASAAWAELHVLDFTDSPMTEVREVVPDGLQVWYFKSTTFSYVVSHNVPGPSGVSAMFAAPVAQALATPGTIMTATWTGMATETGNGSPIGAQTNLALYAPMSENSASQITQVIVDIETLGAEYTQTVSSPFVSMASNDTYKYTVMLTLVGGGSYSLNLTGTITFTLSTAPACSTSSCSKCLGTNGCGWCGQGNGEEIKSPSCWPQWLLNETLSCTIEYNSAILCDDNGGKSPSSKNTFLGISKTATVVVLIVAGVIVLGASVLCVVYLCMRSSRKRYRNLDRY
eukprot:Amastigsp_a841521_495.p1 type:complete len:295 gc:universal Amastigsp_a841521_495:25-909(+)